MFSGLKKVDLEDFTDGLPAILMVLSNSFGTGIAGGLLANVLIKLLAGKGGDVSLGMYVLALPLTYYFWTVVLLLDRRQQALSSTLRFSRCMTEH